ncbi:hypothetical protein WJX73_009375 [Symbiochloris irregularis]|uniref:Nucleotide-diphospho-sugar transferase domain-containing protein n=1 Tax=Symbiochloris irregularis TaxID=706552 RepID=A0AAW1NWV6_9CHLO
MRRSSSSSHKALRDGSGCCPQPSRLVLAVLIGIALGLLVSIGTISRNAHRRSIAEAAVVHETLMAKISQQEKRLLEVDSSYKTDQQQQDRRKAQTASLEAEVANLRAQVSMSEQRAEAADRQADASSKRAEAVASELHMVAKQLRAANTQAVQVTETPQADRHTPWSPSRERDAKDPELATILRKIAVKNEVLVAISNKNYAGPHNMLGTWIENVQRVGVGNAMVVALDEQTKKSVIDAGMESILFTMKISDSQKNVGENHAVSGLKFKILRRFLDLGYAVFLSDVDIVTLQNPFGYLVRDSDVESMSDGFDNATAYGYNDVLDDPAMGWARYAHSMRVFCFNSGLFYMRPTEASVKLLDTVAHRIATENGWDQAIFNEVIFFPSHGPYQDPAVTRRVLDIYDFMNSKVLFTRVRHDSALSSRLPAMVHVNYHPDKHARMLAIVERYVHGKQHALDGFPNGSQ